MEPVMHRTVITGGYNGHATKDRVHTSDGIVLGRGERIHGVGTLTNALCVLVTLVWSGEGSYRSELAQKHAAVFIYAPCGAVFVCERLVSALRWVVPSHEYICHQATLADSHTSKPNVGALVADDAIEEYNVRAKCRAEIRIDNAIAIVTSNDPTVLMYVYVYIW